MKNFINRLMAEGCSPVHNFAELGPIPPRPHRSWEVGCTIHFPKELCVLQQTIYAPNGGEMCLPVAVVVVTFPDGETVLDRLFLSTLVKTVRPIDCEGTTAFKTTHGTAVDFIRQFPAWSEALTALRGRDIKVIADDVYEVRSMDGEYVRPTHLYGFDLCKSEYPLAA